MQNDEMGIQQLALSDMQYILNTLEKLDIGFAKTILKDRIELLKKGKYIPQGIINPKADE